MLTETINRSQLAALDLGGLIRVADFDYVNPDIKRFFAATCHNANISRCEVIGFERTMTSDEVEKHLLQQGFAAANVVELVAFAILYPEFQRTTPVVALGSTWAHTTSDYLVPALWGGAKSREFNVCSRGTRWFSGDAFLARKA